MKRIIFGLLALFASYEVANAQSAQNPVVAPGGVCGTLSLTPGATARHYVDSTGNDCSSASIGSVTIAGGFTAAALGTPFTASEAGATGTLPAGLITVVSNSGPVGAFCALGGTPGLTGQFISGGGGWFAYTKGAATQVSCKTAATTGNTTINMVGGTGLPTGTGGGGGGSGGSSAITSWAGGTLGAMANYGTSPGAVLVPGMNSFVTNAAAVGTAGVASPDVLTVQGVGSMTPLLVTLTSGSVTAITTWGGGTLGAMANYGTSPGAVLVPGVNAAVTNGAASGAAGSASTDVISVQGIAAMTPLSVVPDGTANMAKETGGNLASILTAVQGPVPAGTNVIGHVINDASTAVIGHVINDASTAVIGHTISDASSAVIGHVIVDSGTITGVTTVGAVTAITNALPAGTNTVGGVIAGGTTVEVCVGLTTTNSTYAANTNIGGLITMANLFGAKGSGVIQAVRVDFKTAQTVEMDLYPFSGNPSSSTWTDSSANAINAADVYKVEPPIVMSTPKSGLGTHTVYYASGIGQAMSVGATSGYFILSPTATTASLAGTTGAQVCVTVLRDDP